jgi:hypothetical protein
MAGLRFRLLHSKRKKECGGRRDSSRAHCSTAMLYFQKQWACREQWLRQSLGLFISAPWVPDRRNWKSALYAQLQLDPSWEKDEVTKNAACFGMGFFFCSHSLLISLKDLFSQVETFSCLLLKDTTSKKHDQKGKTAALPNPKQLRPLSQCSHKKVRMPSTEQPIVGGQLYGSWENSLIKSVNYTQLRIL